MTEIADVGDREKLKPRPAPYFRKISKGCYLGFRKLSPGASGTWIARFFSEDDGKQLHKSLGDFGNLPNSKRYDAAAKAADEWFVHLGKGGSNEVVTIATVCSRYVEHLKDQGKEKAASDVERRFKAYVLNNAKLANTELQKLQPSTLLAWRRNLAKTPTKAGANRGGERSKSSLNRDMTCLRAALNHSFEDQLCTSDLAWRKSLKVMKGEDSQRDVYLDLPQRRALAAKAPADLAILIRAMSLVPVRPGALTQLKVGDYDRHHKTLRIGKDKTGARAIALPDNTAKFFADLCESRMPNLPLLTREDGKAWNKDSWKKPIKATVKAAQLPDNITLYALRHSTITDLVHGGLDLLTVGQISGTSQRMIEKHYGHLNGQQAKKALSMLTL